jgi:D-mannonate dehydratase
MKGSEITLNFNVSLDNEQINEIASITADKVLATVQYQKNDAEWYDKEIKQLKLKVSKRDSMLVQKDLYAERLKETIKKLRIQLDNK